MSFLAFGFQFCLCLLRCGGDRSQLPQVVSEEVGRQPKEGAPDVQSLSGPVDRAPGAGTREITGRKCLNRANATQSCASVPQGQGQAHDHRWQVLSDGAHLIEQCIQEYNQSCRSIRSVNLGSTTSNHEGPKNP